MSNYNSIKALFNDIAVKIQDKLGNHTDKIKADDFPSAIESIAGGEWLPSADTVLATFARRQSGGDGPATIEKIYGKTEVWNQLLEPLSLTYWGNSGYGSWTYTDDVAHLDFTSTPGQPAQPNIQQINAYSPVVGHIYFVTFLYRTGANNTLSSVYGRFGTNFNLNLSGLSANMPWTRITRIITATNASMNFLMWCYFTNADTESYTVDFYLGKPNIIDLTKMYGEGKEPSTVEEFLSMHPEALTAPYDAGSLLPVKAESIITQGANQWDEEWERGSYSLETGEPSDYARNFRSKNAIGVIASTAYYIKTPFSTYVLYYDGAGNYLSQYKQLGAGGGSFTPPAGCSLVRLTVGASGADYNHDICINISDSSINGQYFPHHNSDVGLPILKHFPTGLRGVGDSYDEIGPKKKVQRRGVVDLGALEWTLHNSDNVFRTSLPQGMKAGQAANVSSVLCPKYITTYVNNVLYGDKLDKSISVSSFIYIKDSAYTDAATFKTAMSGVELDYELAEPIETDINEDMTYLPQLGGTEEVSPISAEFKAEIRYARKINE